MSIPFPTSPPYKFSDIKKYIHLRQNNYLMCREETINNINYFSMSEEEKIESIKHIESMLLKKSYLITTNKYPYWLEEGLEHKIIWMGKNNKNILPLKICLENLIKSGYKDFVLFHNSPQNKSINHINHFHVIYMRD